MVEREKYVGRERRRGWIGVLGVEREINIEGIMVFGRRSIMKEKGGSIYIERERERERRQVLEMEVGVYRKRYGGLWSVVR